MLWNNNNNRVRTAECTFICPHSVFLGETLSRYWDRLCHVRSTGNQLLEYLENHLTWNHQILHRYSCRQCLWRCRIWHHYLHPVGENGGKYRLRRLRVEFLENLQRYDYEILRTSGVQPAPQICRKWRHQQLPVGCKMLLNPTQKCAKPVRLAKESNNLATV